MEEADVIRIVESSIAKKNESLLASMKLMLESSLTDLKRSHAETADSHVNEIKKLKFDEAHRFKKKWNEDQYRFNVKVGDAIEEAKEACSSQQLDKVHASLEKGEKLLSERQKHILLANKSDLGWSLIREYKTQWSRWAFWWREKDYSSGSQSTYPSQAKLGSQQDKISQQQKGAFHFIASRDLHFQAISH